MVLMHVVDRCADLHGTSRIQHDLAHHVVITALTCMDHMQPSCLHEHLEEAKAPILCVSMLHCVTLLYTGTAQHSSQVSAHRTGLAECSLGSCTSLAVHTVTQTLCTSNDQSRCNTQNASTYQHSWQGTTQKITIITTAADHTCAMRHHGVQISTSLACCWRIRPSSSAGSGTAPAPL